jgi:hypothetical protein
MWLSVLKFIDLSFFTLKNFRIDQPEEIPANLYKFLLHSKSLIIEEITQKRTQTPV